MIETTRTLLFVIPLCGAALLGCSASADENPYGTPSGSGASTSTGGGGSGGSGGSTVGAGGVSATGGATTSAGGASTGGGGSSSTGGSVGTSGSTGTGGTPPQMVSLALPYTEDWESGTINSYAWLPSDPALLSTFSIVDDEDGKALQFADAGNEIQLVGGDVAWTDVKLELKMKIVTGTPQLAIAVRYAAVKSFYFLEIADGHFKIRDRSGGASDIIPVGDEPALVAGQWYTITLVAQGQTFTGSVDGVEIATGTFSGGTPIANGGIGLGSKSSISGSVLFDDITVSAP